MAMAEKRYYVYMHRRGDDGTVFYIGKGTGKQSTSKTGRNKDWKVVAGSAGYTVEVYKANLTEQEAFDLEKHLVSKYPNLVNKRKGGNLTKSIPEEIRNRYFIDSNSPSGVSRVTSKGTVYAGSISKRYTTGEPSGWVIHIKPGVKITAHRLILKILGIDLKTNEVVNHINCNPLDNRVENLEICSTAQNNQRNRATIGLTLARNNSSGENGISEVTTKNGKNTYKYAACSWSENGKSKMKKFSYNKYGKEVAWELARHHRKNMVENFYKDKQK